MTRRLAAAALSVVAAGCVHYVGSPAAASERPGTARGAFAVSVGDRDKTPIGAIDPHAVLERRLLARGASEVVRTDEPAPSLPRLELFLLGDRMTPFSRWTGFPLALATLVTLGLVPAREAREHFVEVHAIFPDAPPGRRVRIARRSWVEVSWTWLPLALAGTSRADARSVRAEGLGRAIDAALDEVLAPDPPGPIARDGAPGEGGVPR